MSEETYGVFIPGRETAEAVFDSKRRAEDKARMWRRKFSSGFKVIETDPKNPEVRPEEKYSAENDSDSVTTMSYDFIANDEDEESDNQQSDSPDFSEVGNKWDLGDHSSASSEERSGLSEAIEETMQNLDGDIDGDMMAVLQDASDLVQDTRLSRFECPVEACGLGHSHSDHKHDIRSAFHVEKGFAEQMKFCPYCHCGANELAMLMSFFPYISEPVFNDQKFEEVLEVKSDVLEEMYNLYVQDDATVSIAAARVSSRRGVPESELVPLGTREAIKSFFQRRRDIEEAAQAAPIATETRNAIDSLREELEEAVSQ